MPVSGTSKNTLGNSRFGVPAKCLHFLPDYEKGLGTRELIRSSWQLAVLQALWLLSTHSNVDGAILSILAGMGDIDVVL
jgi:hypothetical protein